MTDRYSSLTVVLDRDILADDAEALIGAISMIKGVASVAGPAEPFGYVITTGRGRDYFQRDTPETHTLGVDWTVTSVYAHPAPATVEMREALEDIAAFDSEMRGYADVGYFDGGELSKAWKRQAAPAIDRLRAALAPATEGRKS